MKFDVVMTPESYTNVLAVFLGSLAGYYFVHFSSSFVRGVTLVHSIC